MILRNSVFRGWRRHRVVDSPWRGEPATVGEPLAEGAPWRMGSRSDGRFSLRQGVATPCLDWRAGDEGNKPEVFLVAIHCWPALPTKKALSQNPAPPNQITALERAVAGARLRGGKIKRAGSEYVPTRLSLSANLRQNRSSSPTERQTRRLWSRTPCRRGTCPDTL